MEQQESRSLWFKLFIGFHVLAIVVSTLPRPAVKGDNRMVPARIDGFYEWNDRYLRQSPIQQYMQSLGIWQSWDMFAPNPSNRDVWGSAEVLYRDGTLMSIPYPRAQDYSIPERYVHERYRKLFERINLEAFSGMWPSFAQAMAVRAAKDPANPPVKVWVRRHLKIIPDGMPASEYFAQLQRGPVNFDTVFPPPPAMPEEFQNTVLCDYVVDQDRLFAAKRWER